MPDKTSTQFATLIGRDIRGFPIASIQPLNVSESTLRVNFENVKTVESESTFTVSRDRKNYFVILNGTHYFSDWQKKRPVNEEANPIISDKNVYSDWFFIHDTPLLLRVVLEALGLYPDRAVFSNRIQTVESSIQSSPPDPRIGFVSSAPRHPLIPLYKKVPRIKGKRFFPGLLDSRITPEAAKEILKNLVRVANLLKALGIAMKSWHPIVNIETNSVFLSEKDIPILINITRFKDSIGKISWLTDHVGRDTNYFPYLSALIVKGDRNNLSKAENNFLTMTAELAEKAMLEEPSLLDRDEIVSNARREFYNFVEFADKEVGHIEKLEKDKGATRNIFEKYIKVFYLDGIISFSVGVLFYLVRSLDYSYWENIAGSYIKDAFEELNNDIELDLDAYWFEKGKKLEKEGIPAIMGPKKGSPTSSGSPGQGGTMGGLSGGGNNSGKNSARAIDKSYISECDEGLISYDDIYGREFLEESPQFITGIQIFNLQSPKTFAI